MQESEVSSLRTTLQEKEVQLAEARSEYENLRYECTVLTNAIGLMEGVTDRPSPRQAQNSRRIDNRLLP